MIYVDCKFFVLTNCHVFAVNHPSGNVNNFDVGAVVCFDLAANHQVKRVVCWVWECANVQGLVTFGIVDARDVQVALVETLRQYVIA